MAGRRAFEPFLILALLSGCIGVDPCTDYILMWMEYGRRSSDYNSMDTVTSICDAYLNDGTWYRFEHDAGNKLIERPVEPWYCGTQAPIWLNGTHPTDTTEVTAKVCSTYSSSNVCGWNGTVRIQLCNESESEYFVYLLAIPPGCALAYCVDAASRKQCVPPLIWLSDEFQCGELEEDNSQGIVLFLQSADASQDAMIKVVENQQKIDTVLRNNINLICSHDATLCCGFTIKSISSDLIEYVTSSDIFAAKGFPKSRSGIVHYKIIAIINEAVNKATCMSKSIDTKAKRQVQSTDTSFILFEVMKMASINGASRILQETGLTVTAYVDPKAYPDANEDDDSCPTVTCIVPIVICCTIIVVVAIGLIIGCRTVHKMRKSKTEPESEKKTDFAESNTAHPIVNSVHTEMERQPEKPPFE